MSKEAVTVTEAFITNLLIRAIMLLAGFGVFFLGCVFWYFDARFQSIEDSLTEHTDGGAIHLDTSLILADLNNDIQEEELRLTALEVRVYDNYTSDQVILSKLTYIESWIKEIRQREAGGE